MVLFVQTSPNPIQFMIFLIWEKARRAAVEVGRRFYMEVRLVALLFLLYLYLYFVFCILYFVFEKKGSLLQLVACGSWECGSLGRAATRYFLLDES